MKKWFENSLATIVFVIAASLIGGFYDDIVAVIGLLIALSLLYCHVKKYPVYEQIRNGFYQIPYALLCIAFVVTLWSQDKTDNLMGAMRIGVVLLWMYFLRFQTKENRKRVVNCIPWIGVIMVLCALISYPIRQLRGYFWEYDRMSGTMQYANAFGLFLLVGIVLCLQELMIPGSAKKEKLLSLTKQAVLLLGLGLTGSRSTVLLFILVVVYYAIKNRKLRLPLLLGTAGLGVAAFLFYLLTGSDTNLGRIFTLFTQSSTLWGRLLYYRDGCVMLFSRLWGWGYMGYNYAQGLYQTGVYRVRFIHNDFLQIGLDYGLLAMVVLVAYVVWQIIKGKQSVKEKELLALVCLGSLMDFYLQYPAIVMCAALFVDQGESTKKIPGKMRKENYLFLPVIAAVFAYVAVATGSLRAGNVDTALSLLPSYTRAQVAILKNTGDVEQVLEKADALLDRNDCVAEAYLMRARAYAYVGDFDKAMEDMDRLLELKPYEIEIYRTYSGMLKTWSEQASYGTELGGYAYTKLQERLEKLPMELSALRGRTSPLAYKINDKPEFDL